MAESRSMTTPEVLAKTLIDEHPDFLREAARVAAHELMEAESSAEIGALRGEGALRSRQPLARHAPVG